MKFNKEELKIISMAVVEHEQEHYSNKGRKWQNVINNLIDKLREVEE